LYNKYLTIEAPEGFGDFKIGGKVICTVKYADDLVVLSEEEPVLQGMLERLIEFGRCNGIKTNVERTKALRISRQPSPTQTMINKKKQKDNVEYFNYLCSMITNDARCASEVTFRISKATAAFNKKILFTSKMELNFGKKQ
jgi:hypothetical protein